MYKYRVLGFIVREIWISVTAKTSYLLFSTWKFKDRDRLLSRNFLVYDSWTSKTCEGVVQYS